ncbi:dTDP-4-dehydrorhamnose reductase [Paenibacillus sp.]|uniref:dTDP-4-dehydrorhamnose reductase n=1 Tax=Paenibacillus sp. TaxID=58172 RepID=UPI003568090A
MKILVTGAGGQLARELLCYCENIYPFKKEELDITNRDQCEEVYNRIKPDLIIHCAAYTKVDDAENKKSEAYRVNYHGTVHLADLTKQNNSKLCFISTDYVFDGEKSSPYFETDYTNPVNFYGVSKRDAEDYIQNNVPNHYIVRTSWLYGKVGNNFVKTMIKLANINQTIRVVDDQVGSPTNANDLAYFIIQLIKTDKYGFLAIVHG